MASSATNVPPMSLTPTVNWKTLGRLFSSERERGAGVCGGGEFGGGGKKEEEEEEEEELLLLYAGW